MIHAETSGRLPAASLWNKEGRTDEERGCSEKTRRKRTHAQNEREGSSEQPPKEHKAHKARQIGTHSFASREQSWQGSRPGVQLRVGQTSRQRDDTARACIPCSVWVLLLHIDTTVVRRFPRALRYAGHTQTHDTHTMPRMKKTESLVWGLHCIVSQKHACT